MKNSFVPLILALTLIHTGCTTSALDVAPLAKYQTLRPGTTVVVVTYLGEKKIEDKGTLTEMQKDHLLVWSETTSGWMTLLFPGRMVHEIRALPEGLNQSSEPTAMSVTPPATQEPRQP